MPIYEYACQECGKTFEYMQSVNDERRTECEECGGELKKLISSTSFQLKGSGWYKDLYSSSKPKSSGDSTSETKTETKTESKTETKTETKTSKGGDSK